MSKRVAWLAAAGIVVVLSAGAGIRNWQESHKPMFLRGETGEAEHGRPPVDGASCAFLAFVGVYPFFRVWERRRVCCRAPASPASSAEGRR